VFILLLDVEHVTIMLIYCCCCTQQLVRDLLQTYQTTRGCVSLNLTKPVVNVGGEKATRGKFSDINGVQMFQFETEPLRLMPGF